MTEFQKNCIFFTIWGKICENFIFQTILIKKNLKYGAFVDKFVIYMGSMGEGELKMGVF